MPSAMDGFRNILITGVSGFVLYAILRQILLTSGYGYALFLLTVVSIVAIILLFDNMTYWGISYLMGWLVGLVLIGPSLFEWWEIFAYGAAGIFSLGVKIFNKFG